MNIFEMFGGQYNRQLIEKIYIQNNKDFEVTLDMFLTGAVPSEQKEELHVIIEEKKEQKVQKIDTTANEIQKNKKRQDLRQYVLQEYSNVLGSQGLDHNKMKGNKYYQNHLKALELMREQEKQEA